MNSELKSKIYYLIDSIKDENILQMLMEDVVYYTNKKDIIDEAISEADNNETIDWNDFKKEMNEWKKR